jgi:uncharacterized protein (UPF0276 family)
MTSKIQSTPTNKPLVGLGLRHPHYDQALAEPADLDFVELHAENLYPSGGAFAAFKKALSDTYAVSIHGTSLGLGSAVPLPETELQKFVATIEQTNAFLVSEHICFNRALVQGQLIHAGDLYPIAYNEDNLAQLAQQVTRVQAALGRPLLLENLSAYLPELEHRMSEATFLTELVAQTGCQLLLDLNNVLVNLHNQAHLQPIDAALAWVKTLPVAAIGEIHLAGFTPRKTHGFYVDDHAQPVSEECWELYREVIAEIGVRPTLIEWDNDLPEWHTLLTQAQRARHIMQSCSPVQVEDKHG